MNNRVKKMKSAEYIGVKIVLTECISRRSVRPVLWLIKKDFRYGTRNQLEGSLIDYVKYCRRKRIGIDVSYV